MGLFERFARVESPDLELTLLPAEGAEPEFQVTVKVLSDKQNNMMMEQASSNNVLDIDRFRKIWGKKVVVNWSGLTVNNLRRLIPNIVIDENKLVSLFPDRIIPYSPEMAADLHLNAVTNFRAKIHDATDEARRQQNEEVEQGRSADLGN